MLNNRISTNIIMGEYKKLHTCWKLLLEEKQGL